MRTPSRSRPNSLSRFTPLAAAVAGVLAAQAAMAACPTAGTGPLCVTKTANDGTAGSLTFAINSANTNCGSVANPVIEFDIPGTGPFVIQIPALGHAFDCASNPYNPVIDGTTQPGSSPNTSSAGFNAVNPIVLSANGVSITGIQHSSGFAYGGALTVKGIDFRDFFYGGATPCSFAQPCALSGPVIVTGSRFSNSCNGVGADSIDPDGFFGGGAEGPSRVGGPTLAERNAFFGNHLASIITTSYGGQVNIVNNFIGTADGTTAGGGTAYGISFPGAASSTIMNNVISGNGAAGIQLQTVDGITIQGNKIGLGITGASLPNAGDGIRSTSGSSVTITGNTIAFNSGSGFNLPDGSGHALSGNLIFGNGVKAINLGDVPGQVANDPDDVDFGANDLQNFPVISSVVKDAVANATTINWTLNSTGSSSFDLEFFSNPAATAVPQATAFIGSVSASIGAGTFTSGSTPIPGLHDFITATATNSGLGQTSELGSMALAKGLDLAPTSLNFGSVVVGATSASASASLTSIGAAPFTISFLHGSSLCYGGPPAPPAICSGSQFNCSTTCNVGQPYSIGTSCSISASFSPIALGPQTTTIYICDDAGGNPRTLTLSGTAVAPPPATITPASFDFGSVVVGTAHAGQAFTVTNPGPTPITLTAFSATAPFQVASSTCGATLAPTSSCTVTATYAPAALGPSTGTLSSTASSGGVSANLNGTGAAPPPATITPTAHNFGPVEVGGVSANKVFTVGNPAPVSITLTPFAISAPFEIVANTCAGTLAAAATCTVTTRFAPVSAVASSGTLSSSASSGGVSATVDGTGTAGPPPALTPASFDFGTVVLGTSSAPHTFTLTNPALVTMAVADLAVTPPFALLGTTCGTTLAPGGSCTTDVKFSPSAVGLASGFLQLTAGGFALSSDLTGTGSALPLLQISPAMHDFGTVVVGAVSAGKTFSITNPAAISTAISAPATAAPFQVVSTTCGASLAAAGSCNAVVRFVPTANGAASGSLVVSSSAGPASATLLGSGLRQPAASLPTSPIDFGSLIVGGAPVQRTIALTNTGNAILGINSVSVSPPFTRFTTCDASLAAGGSCNITVEFDPVAVGDFGGVLTVSTNAPGGSSIRVPLHAAVQQRPEPRLVVSPSIINFGARFAGSAAPTQTVTLVNEGGQAATLDVSLTVPFFEIVGASCGATLAPGASCGIEMGFVPNGFGPRRAELVIRTNAPGSPFGVSLSGAGCRPVSIAQSRGAPSVDCSP